jgi:biotin carboxyl carrier protein
VALLGVGGYAGYERFAAPPVVAAQITTADVAVGTITATISATGNIAAATQSALGFKSSGVLDQLLVKVGDQVSAGQPLIWLEAMKMEHTISAPTDGVLTQLDVKPGDQVEVGAVLARVEQPETSMQAEGDPQ